MLGVTAYAGFHAAKIAVALVAAAAASALGGLVGFLFGVPRAPASSVDLQETRDPVSDQRSDTSRRNSFRPNTNLEQVSDWLTKIIVGVGLVQFRQIGIVIGDAGRVVGAAIGDAAGAPGSGTVFAIALMAATAVVAFLLAYMWTTTILYNVYVKHLSDGAL